MKLGDLIQQLIDLGVEHSDLEVVVQDNDTGYLFPLLTFEIKEGLPEDLWGEPERDDRRMLFVLRPAQYHESR